MTQATGMGLVGRKLGMTRLFLGDGRGLPVTVLDVAQNRIVRIKEAAKDGYTAVQVGVGKRRPDRMPKAAVGQFVKAGVEPGRMLKEFRVTPEQAQALTVGGEIKADIFALGQRVDVQGTTIGKGFAGVMKRHGFGGGRATHGASVTHRHPGSIGQRQTPGRVFPGKKMGGHMGAVQRTQIGLEVVQIDGERGLLLVKGAVPGPKGQDLVVRPSVRKYKAAAPQPVKVDKKAAAKKPAAKKK